MDSGSLEKTDRLGVLFYIDVAMELVLEGIHIPCVPPVSELQEWG